MKPAQVLSGLVLAVVLLAMVTGLGQAQGPEGIPASAPMEPSAQVTDTFTYQGQLKQDGAPVNGTCDFQFSIWDSPEGGTQFGNTQTLDNVPVTGGHFTVKLGSFHSVYVYFDGRALWLGIAVRCPAGSGSFTALSPRQPLTATPYALSLRPGAQIRGNLTGSPWSVLEVENKSSSEFTFGIRASSWAPKTSAIYGFATFGYGGRFGASEGHALAVHGPTLMGGRNPQQIAMLRWYEVNNAGNKIPVGVYPDQLVFDGAHIWVACYNTNNVWKIRASDGQVIGAYPAGTNPSALAFDGMYIWAPGKGNSNVVKLRASDGATVATICCTPPGEHWGAAFDGEYVWITNKDANSVTKIRAADNTIVGHYATGQGPIGVAYAEGYIWVANSGSGTVSKHSAGGGISVDAYPTGAGAHGVAFDGAHLWVTNRLAATVTKLRLRDGLILDTFPVAESPFFLAFDGYYMWVTHYIAPGKITRIPAAGGETSVFNTGRNPYGIAFDGANIWVADNHDHVVSKH